MNTKPDILSVRLLLNQYISGDTRMRPLVEIPIESPYNPFNMADPTITAIVYFQREIAGFNKADGLVQANGRTHQALLGEKAKTIKPKKVIENPIGELGARPVLLTEDQTQGFSSGGSIALDCHFGGTAVITAGEVWMAIDGQRAVYAASHHSIVYVLLKPRGGVRPGTYMQKSRSFVNDVTMGLAAGEIASRCEYIRYMMELECEFLMALGCAVSAPAAMFVISQEIGPFLVQNYTKFPAWGLMLYHLSRLAWTVYSACPKFFHAILKLAMYRIWDHMGQGPLEFNARSLAKLAGKLIGKVGIKGFTATAGALRTVMTAIIGQLTLSALNASAKISVQEATDQVAQLKAAAISMGSAIDEGTAQAIVVELVENAVLLYPLVRDLKQEVDRLV